MLKFCVFLTVFAKVSQKALNNVLKHLADAMRHYAHSALRCSMCPMYPAKVSEICVRRMSHKIYILRTMFILCAFPAIPELNKKKSPPRQCSLGVYTSFLFRLSLSPLSISHALRSILSYNRFIPALALFVPLDILLSS